MITYYFMTGQWTFAYTFIVELLISEMILFYRKNYLKKHWVRVILPILGFLLLSLFVPPFFSDEFREAHLGLDIIYEIFILIVYFGTSGLALGYAFNRKAYKTIFLACAAYNIQHALHCLKSIIMAVSGVGLYSPLGWTIEGVAILCSILLSFFFRDLFHKIDNTELKDKSILLLISTIIVVNITLGTVSILQKKELVTEIVEKSYAFTCCSFMLFLQFYILKKHSLERKLFSTQLLWEKDKQNYEIQKSNIKEINIKYHDLKRILNTLDAEGTLDKESIAKTRESLNQYDSFAKTGSSALDIVVAEKKMYCNKLGIRFTFLEDGKLIDFMDEVDVYSLFVNILDNAIDACMKIEDPKNRSSLLP